MGCRSSREIEYPESFMKLEDETGFTRAQLSRLEYRFNMLDRYKKGYLGARDLLRIPELAANPLGERIILAMHKENLPPGKPIAPTTLEEIKIPFESFVLCFGRFHAEPGTPEGNRKKLRLLFRMLDLNENNAISLAEIFAVLKTLSPLADEDELVDFSEQILLELAGDEEESVAFEKFCQVEGIEELAEQLSFNFQ